MRRLWPGLLILLFLLAACLHPTPARDAGATESVDAGPSPDGGIAPCMTAAACRATLPIDAESNLVVYENFDLTAPSTAVTRAIIVIHGTERNAATYFESMVAIASTGGHGGSTLIIAPAFQASPQSDDELYWPDGDWREGGDGQTATGVKASSFAALDEIAERLSDRALFPSLSVLIFAGHSAGGQVVQRYAAGANAIIHKDIAVRFIVANPSSFMYLNAFRRVGGQFVNSGPQFDACPDYDSYKYGLQRRTPVPYMAAQSDANLTQRYLNRDVRYLLGTNDTCNSDVAPCDDSSLDKGCEAMIQGGFRLERGRNLFAHLQAFFPNQNHRKIEVPGVGHSQAAMFGSPEGRQSLFE